MKHFSNEIPKNYEAPAIEIIEVEVEKGFANSDLPGQNDATGGQTPGGGGQSGGSSPWSGGAWD